MKSTLAFVSAILVGGVFASCASAALVVDNFESYTAGQAIATSSTSTPWLRFGSVGDNLVASSTATSLIDGTLSARIPVAITSLTGSATVRRNFVTATDLTAYNTATVASKSLTTASTATLQLSITDGTTTYLSAALPETAAATTYTFTLLPANFTLSAGSSTLTSVLASTTSIGFRIGSTTGATAETIAFDDFTLSNVASTPEPGTAAFAAVGLAAFLGKRRR